MLAKNVPDAQRFPYTEYVKPPKYNRAVRLSDVDSSCARWWERFMPRWSAEDHLEASLIQLERYVKASGNHGDAIGFMESKYGDRGPLIAGGLREHWPDDAKDKVRELGILAADTHAAACFHYCAAGKRKPFHVWERELMADRAKEP